MMDSAELAQPAVNLYYNPVIEAVRDRAYLELNAMAKLLNGAATQPPFAEIFFSLDTLLDDAVFLLNSGAIDPFIRVRTSPDEGEAPVTSTTLRIGVYPVAANPFHWAHLLIGLSALTRFKLNTIIYIISGDDSRKPALSSSARRHLVGKKILDMFVPFLKYSSIALGNDFDGETNIFRMLALNPEQKIDAYYIVGSDHYQRINPETGSADTLQKLEDNMQQRIYSFDKLMHRISVLFIKRGAIKHCIDTSLDISFLPEMPFAASSTIVREAFQGRQPMETLALLPYTAFKFADSFQPSRYFLSLYDSRKEDAKLQLAGLSSRV